MLEDDREVPASDGAVVVAADDDEDRRPLAEFELANSEGLPKPSDEPLSSIFATACWWRWTMHGFHGSRA